MSSKNAPGSPGATRDPAPDGARAQRELQLARESLLDIQPGLLLRRESAGIAEPLEGACMELTGWRTTEFQEGAARFADLILPEDRERLESALMAARTEQALYRVDYRIRDRGGNTRWLREVGRSSMRTDRPAELLGIAVEVTREHELQQQLLQAQKMEAVGRLAGGVAHDFNNLLTAILGYSDMLASSLDEGSQERSQAQQVVHAAQRAADLTRKLLAFARRQIVDPRPLDLSDLVLTTDPLLRRVLGEDVELVTLPGHDLGQVIADAGQLEQVLVNLAINARQAMPEGGKLTLETREEPATAAGPRWVVLSVRDTGVGMDSSTRERLFEPFFTTRSEGTGLGLATCRTIVEQAGGQIAVESAPGRGTSVTVRLPRSEAERPSTRLRVKPAEVGGGSECVLIVEDEPLVRQVAADALLALGYEVLSARSGIEALELLAERGERELDLLVTDLILPQMSGHEVARRVLARSPATRVLYISGHASATPPEGGPSRMDASFLAKPFTPRGLAAAVRAALDAG